MDGERQDFGALLALGVEPVELIDGAAHQIVALVMLDHHHRDVVELDRIGQRDQRAVGGADHRRLVVIDPVADIFDAGGGENFGRVEVSVRPGPSQPSGRLPQKRSMTSSERSIIAF